MGARLQLDSGTGETPNGAKRRGGLPRGKRAPGAEINNFQKQQYMRNS